MIDLVHIHECLKDVRYPCMAYIHNFLQSYFGTSRFEAIVMNHLMLRRNIEMHLHLILIIKMSSMYLHPRGA